MFDEGISHTSLLVDLAAEANIIQKSGAWYSYGDQRIGQGRENAKLFLRDNPPLMAEVEGKVKELLGVHAAVAPGPPADGGRRVTLAGHHRARARSAPPGHAPGGGRRQPVRRGARGRGCGCRPGARARAWTTSSASGSPRRPTQKRPSAPRSACAGAPLVRAARPRPPAAAQGAPARRGRRGARARHGAGPARRCGLRPRTTSQTRTARGRGPPGSRAICWPWASSASLIDRAIGAEWHEGTDRAGVPRRSPQTRAAQLGNLPRSVKRRRVLAFLARRGFSGR